MPVKNNYGFIKLFARFSGKGCLEREFSCANQILRFIKYGNNNTYYYTDRNDAKLDATEEDACTADVSAPKLPPKPQPQVE